MTLRPVPEQLRSRAQSAKTSLGAKRHTDGWVLPEQSTSFALEGTWTNVDLDVTPLISDIVSSSCFMIALPGVISASAWKPLYGEYIGDPLTLAFKWTSPAGRLGAFHCTSMSRHCTGPKEGTTMSAESARELYWRWLAALGQLCQASPTRLHHRWTLAVLSTSPTWCATMAL
ncbi:hypothetical protein E4T38_01533 [Aureobasidium subglaciale]|nr:hypothetical protein E4T38_01533 [Aureobasidium subglaciale]KAI5219089.1 hypothetical protein E4T40_06615 [Aureobasidium subglaciale]KAI5233196.1 hypothetical protein E4T41_01531 [Aureobasidium subglaciale]KAI5260055.1 hypothetical protein E4T46_06415 [Aureobasidium subglaciale]